MSDRRLDDLLHDPRAHQPAALSEAELRLIQERVLVRFAAESAPAQSRSWLRLLERAAIPVSVAALLVAASGWLGSLWSSTEITVVQPPKLPRLDVSWFRTIAEAMAQQPWMSFCVLTAVAMLWLPPVRSALFGEANASGR